MRYLLIAFVIALFGCSDSPNSPDKRIGDNHDNHRHPIDITLSRGLWCINDGEYHFWLEFARDTNRIVLVDYLNN